ncbi:MAG: P1 family peptidase, partial [Clostridia bacterium]|nr:P1 family peptidase [Clostridia bacterium]
EEEEFAEPETTEEVRVEPAPAETVEPAEPKNVPEVLDAPETAEVIQEPVKEETPAVNEQSKDMGYDITFNTTISCLITNAKLTKAQCNKLASILHDGYARAIKPVHSTMDGDTIFVMTTGEKDVNFDAFAALATDIVQYSVIDGAISAESAYGLPAAREFLRK